MNRILVLAAVLLIAAVPAAAKNDNDPGYKILHDYVLTMPKLQAYEVSYAALNTAAKADPALAADVRAASSEADPSVADTINKMNKHPRVYAFFQKQGLSKPEAALLPLILMNACMGAQYPTVVASMGTMMTQGQADFCKTNMARIKTLKFFSGH